MAFTVTFLGTPQIPQEPPARHEREERLDDKGFLGNPEYGCDLQPIDFARFAEACGGRGFTVEDPADCGRVLDDALAAPGPAIVQAVVDPFEPPLPAKITMEQAAKFAQSLLRGEPNREKIALTVLADRVRELV